MSVDLTDPKVLVQATLEYIERHPEEHDQEAWRCETGMCFAGHMASLHPNVRWKVEHPLDFEDGNTSLVVDESGYTMLVSSWARQFLFLANPDSLLAYEQAQRLFAYNNTLPMLTDMVEDYVEGRVIRKPNRVTDEY